jgi:EAL domain-containing protein (putative c-di-GMP-specific phosphodiesterase class I)
MTDAIASRHALETQLRSALENEEFVLHYQPKVDLRSGLLTGAEALIRWRHPTQGLIPPGRFIPMLEHAGLTHWVTRWVIEEAGAMLQRTGLAAAGFRISVNLSPQDLMEPDLVDFIVRSLAPPMPAGSLWLEITETGLIHDPVRMRETLAYLHKAGARFSVDDFGTGYASLSYMSEFPVDEVKIDRSFVGDMLGNERHYIIVRSTIALAHELGLPVTAEGVEDKATLDALIGMSCDTGQGFFFSRPLEEESLLEFLATSLEDKFLS